MARKKVLVTWRRVGTIQLTPWNYAASAWEFWGRGRLMMAGALKKGSRKDGTWAILLGLVNDLEEEGDALSWFSSRRIVGKSGLHSMWQSILAVRAFSTDQTDSFDRQAKGDLLSTLDTVLQLWPKYPTETTTERLFWVHGFSKVQPITVGKQSIVYGSRRECWRLLLLPWTGSREWLEAGAGLQPSKICPSDLLLTARPYLPCQFHSLLI